MQGVLRSTLAAALIVLTAMVAPVAAQAKRRVPTGFFGTVLEPKSGDPAYSSNAALDSTFAVMARSGVESVRVTFAWNQLEPAPGFFDFRASDRIVSDAARHGIHILANLLYTPLWASSSSSQVFGYRYAPRNPQTWATFVSTVARRYGPHGSFWRANPGLPHVSVREWQIWNEQAFNVFWATQPWARTYTQLLRAAYVDIHRADRGAKVVAGSLAADNQSNQWQQMSALYRAGAKRYFDIISVHPFTQGTIPVSQSVSRAMEIVKFVRDVMRRNGDSRKPIILTELSWPGARGFVNPSRLIGLETTPRGEIQRLSAAYNYLATHQRQTGVTQAYWFSWASTFDPNDVQSDVGYRFAGLNKFANGSFIPQPVLGTYAHLALRFEGCRRKASNGRCL
ncbi:MAG: beta-galactosidase [Solirubrobacterales bacterium]|nr:beta-galactosidase [Solirubrobacterales bacterium]